MKRDQRSVSKVLAKHALACGAFTLLGACTLPMSSTRADAVKSYRYSSFDFSGTAWQQQSQVCALAGKKPEHVDTVCGFWLCTSRFSCQ